MSHFIWQSRDPKGRWISAGCMMIVRVAERAFRAGFSQSDALEFALAQAPNLTAAERDRITDRFTESLPTE